MSRTHERGPAAGSRSMRPPLLDGEYADSDLLYFTYKDDEKSSVFQVPSILMRTLMERSRDANLPLAPPENLIDVLHASGIHFISRVRRVFAPAPEQDERTRLYEWARGYVQLRLSDDAVGNRAYCFWMDIDLPIMGRLVEAMRNTPGAVVPRGQHGTPVIPVMPRWAGSYSFAQVFERTAALAQSRNIGQHQFEIPTKQMMALSEAEILARAHVLVVPPEQVEVLPEWEDPQEAFDYIAEATLPFEPLYLDFTGPGAIGPHLDGVNGEKGALSMVGALVWRQFDKNGETTMIAPYGWPTEMPIQERDGTVYEPSPFESMGWFAFNSAPATFGTGEVVKIGEVKLTMQGTMIYGMSTTVWADACADADYWKPWEPLDNEPPAKNLPGYACLPYPLASVHERMKHEGDDTAEHLAQWGTMIWRLVSRALAALSITEAVEVEIVDAPMEKRDRKRADKRKWPIAQQVVIRSHSKRYRDAGPGSGGAMEYSHRFWRRAHVAHYPLGTRLADARPDLVTVCKRQVEFNCGFCRKVKRPATIVGPPDKPLVLKTLLRQKSG